MLTSQLNVTFSMVWVMVLDNLVAVVVAFALLKPLTRLTFISGPLLVPFLLIVLGLGAYTANNTFADVVVMLAAAAVGVAAIRWDWPRVPFLLAVVLGGIAERYLFLSYSLFGWAWLTRPIVLLLFAILALLALRQGVMGRRRRDSTSVSA
jgi:TctA family transporter